MAENENDEAVPSKRALESPSYPSNRLSIGHLLLWMTTTACTLAVLAPEFSKEPEFGSKLFAIAVAPILGASVGALLLALWRALHVDPQFPVQPGHWLSVAMGIIAGTLMILMPIGRMLPSPSRAIESFEFLSALASVVAAIASAVMLVIAAMNEQMPRLWRLALRVVATSVGLMIVSGCMMIPIPGPATWAAPVAFFIYFSGPGAVLAAAVADAMTGIRYDLFHWMGVATILLVFGMPWVMFFFG